MQAGIIRDILWTVLSIIMLPILGVAVIVWLIAPDDSETKARCEMLKYKMHIEKE
jgi:hypothetical protein